MQEPPARISGAHVWTRSFQLALGLLRRSPRLGLKRLVLPLTYWRMAEFRYMFSALGTRRPRRLLDLGSPKQLPVLLARHLGCEVVTADIVEAEVEVARRYAEALGVWGRGVGRVHAELQDGRKLPYLDASFDAVTSVSVLEHVPDDGDTRAIRELARVLKPGGTLVFTVPFDRKPRETWVDRDVYDRRRQGTEPIFYQRHYDDSTLRSRLVEPSGADLLDLEIWGEGTVRMESWLARAGRAAYPISPLEPLLSVLFLKRMVGAGGHPMAAFVTLRKPPDGEATGVSGR